MKRCQNAFGFLLTADEAILNTLSFRHTSTKVPPQTSLAVAYETLGT